MKNIIPRKPIDEDYRNEAERLLEEWASKKAGPMDPALVDDSTVATLFRKVEPFIKKAMYYYARRRRMLEVTRILPHNAAGDVLIRHYRDIEYCDMPKKFLNITALVPDWKEIISKLLRE